MLRKFFKSMTENHNNFPITVLWVGLMEFRMHLWYTSRSCTLRTLCKTKKEKPQFPRIRFLLRHHLRNDALIKVYQRLCTHT